MALERPRRRGTQCSRRLRSRGSCRTLSVFAQSASMRSPPGCGLCPRYVLRPLAAENQTSSSPSSRGERNSAEGLLPKASRSISSRARSISWVFGEDGAPPITAGAARAGRPGRSVVDSTQKIGFVLQIWLEAVGTKAILAFRITKLLYNYRSKMRSTPTPLRSWWPPSAGPR